MYEFWYGLTPQTEIMHGMFFHARYGYNATRFHLDVDTATGGTHVTDSFYDRHKKFILIFNGYSLLEILLTLNRL